MSWGTTSLTTVDTGRFQIVVNDVDVTYFRDVPTKISSIEFNEPYDDGPCIIEFPQISAFDVLGTDRSGTTGEPGDDLSWLTDWADVDIWLVPADYPSSPKIKFWEGLVAAFRETYGESTSLTAECIGALYQLDMYVRAPLYVFEEQSVKELMEFNFNSREHLRTQPLLVEGTVPAEFTTRNTGSWNRLLTEYMTELLSHMVEADGSQWTLMMNEDRQPVLKKKDLTTVHWTVPLGQRGVKTELQRELMQAPNVFYGEGVDEAGARWSNATTGPDVAGTYAPIAYKEEVHPIRDSGGNLLPETDLNAVRVEQQIDFGAKITLDEGITWAERELAKNGDFGWVGTITMRSDPEEGSRFLIRAGDNIKLKNWHNTGATGQLFHVSKVVHDVEALTSTLTVDTNGRDTRALLEAMRRNRAASITPWKSINVKSLSSIVDDEKRNWDLAAGAGYIPSTSKSSQDAIYQGASRTSAPHRPVDDTFVEPDRYGTNYLWVKGTGGHENWAVGTTKVSEVGLVRTIRVQAFDAGGNPKAVPFHVSVYTSLVGPSTFATFDPFENNVWRPDTFGNLFAQPPFLVIGWGAVTNGESQKAGFWPGLQSQGDAATGIFQDDSEWSYNLHPTDTVDPVTETTNNGWLYIAIYCESEAYFQGKLMRGVQQ